MTPEKKRALYDEAQAIIDDIAEYGLEIQDRRTNTPFATKVAQWKDKVARLRDRIKPHKDDSTEIMAAYKGAQSLYADFVGYQQDHDAADVTKRIEWTERVRLDIRNHLR